MSGVFEPDKKLAEIARHNASKQEALVQTLVQQCLRDASLFFLAVIQKYSACDRLPLRMCRKLSTLETPITATRIILQSLTLFNSEFLLLWYDEIETLAFYCPFANAVVEPAYEYGNVPTTLKIVGKRYTKGSSSSSVRGLILIFIHCIGSPGLEWAAALAAFVESPRLKGRCIVPVGHSAGAGAMCLSGPYLYLAIILVEPSFLPRELFHSHQEERMLFRPEFVEKVVQDPAAESGKFPLITKINGSGYMVVQESPDKPALTIAEILDGICTDEIGRSSKF
ncbi:hypothetical protein CPB84DRAFT_1827657 [Gymnopilus junonius]|uniref:Uncharacterized protein n=1 Tax=Gymnopilus junonius TaxID=109634 RepID=A0A9P5NG72_GYMJU|nr:hypothetical protein CPB84DRAFT_1827657 [Gymnopilus junonius]